MTLTPTMAPTGPTPDVDRRDHERIDEDEVRRSEEELATVGNCAGNCGTLVFATVGLCGSCGRAAGLSRRRC